MTENHSIIPHKAGFVAVMGRPNVGKSTLVNDFMGQKIAAVSPRPQTTRRRQLGILTTEAAQIIFIDTPGVHEPRHKLGEVMNQWALEALEDADVILFVVDASQPPEAEDRLLADRLKYLKKQIPIILALNKIDLIPSDQVDARRSEFLGLITPPPENLSGPLVMPVSATTRENIDQLLAEIVAHLPEGEEYYPEEQITDFYERDIAADLIRQAALIYLRDEVPHGITVRVDEFTERGESGAFIAATIFVERESHKGIVIGQGGDMLKKIGSEARQEIEEMSGRKVFLQLRVKVRKNWRNDEKALKQLGYSHE